MKCNIGLILKKFLDKEFSSFKNKFYCLDCRDGMSQLGFSFIKVLNIDKDFNNTLQGQLVDYKPLNQEKKELMICEECGSSKFQADRVEIEWGNIILIYVINSEERREKKSFHSNLFKDIPVELDLGDSNIFELKFLIHEDLKQVFPYVRHEDNYFELNDVLFKETVIDCKDKNFKVNPVLLSYFKKNPKERREMYKQSVNLNDIDADGFDFDNYKICNNNNILPEEIIRNLEFDMHEVELDDDDEILSDLDEDPEKNEHVLVLQNLNQERIQNYLKDFELDGSKYFNDVLIVAPGQGLRPIAACNFPDYDAICHPKSYCGYGQDYDRNRISYTRAIRNEINHWDRDRFGPQEILFKAKEKIKRDLSSCVSTALRKTKVDNLTKKDICDSDKVRQLISKNIAYKILPQIRTSNEYLMKKEHRAKRMIRQFGLCTFFFTLSISESNSPEFLKQAYKNIFHKDITLVEASNLSPDIKSKLVRDDPVLCTEYINHRSQVLLNYLKNSNGLFGENNVEHYMIRSEIQLRGTIHFHCVYWLRNAPVLIPYAKSDIRMENENKVIEFLDRFVSTKYLEDNPSMKFQIHKHTHSCYKNNKKKCRFHYPRFVAHNTVILYPHMHEKDITKERLENLKKIKVKMNYYRKNNVLESFEVMLKDLGLTMSEYYDAIRCGIFKIVILYKRETNAVMVNNYNPVLLDSLENNHDIQFIIDAYAAIHYLFKYCLKVDEGVNFLIEKAVEECRKGNKTIKDTFKSVANVFYNTSCISVQQAVQEIKGYCIVRFSEDEKFINTNLPEDRLYLLKSDLDDLDDDSKDIYVKGFIQEYANRPLSLDLVTLADFAAYYNKSKKSSKKKFDCDDNENSSGDDDNVNDVEVDKNDNSELYTMRSRPRVIRFVNYKLENDPNNYYREMVMLYLPWRDEQKELLNFAKVRETFEQNKDEIFKTYSKYNVITEECLDSLKEKVLSALSYEKQEEIQEFLNDDLSDNEEIDIYEELGIKDEKKSKKKIPKESKSKVVYALKQAPSIDRVNLWAKIRSLNEEQQKIVFHILHLISTRKETDSDEGTKIILQGKAGVGKTYVINVITELVNDYYNRVVGTDFKSNKVLLCAPTGIAAFLINGLTIHSAFSINTKYRKNICKLGDDLIGAIRQEHKDIKVIIADEYSMISRTLRINMDKRCREIYGINNKSFGGKIVIFAGDLFQLPPVNDRAIYACSDYNNVNDYLYDQVWYDFELFELVEGVRQKHKEYQLLLDNFALGQLSKEHADLLKKRIVKSENDVPEDAIWVYYSNKEVNEFNDNRIAKAPGINYESIALDTIHIAQDSKDKDKSSKDSIESNKLAIAKLYAQDISSNTKMRFNLLLK